MKRLMISTEELRVEGLLWSSSTSRKFVALSTIHVSLRSASLISADELYSIIYSSSNFSCTLYRAWPSSIRSFAFSCSLLSTSPYFLDISCSLGFMYFWRLSDVVMIIFTFSSMIFIDYWFSCGTNPGSICSLSLFSFLSF